MGNTSCPICNKEAEIYSDYSYTCNCCGKFRITSEAIDAFKYDQYKNQTAKISAFLRYRDIRGLKPLTIYYDGIEAQKHGNFTISIETILENYPKNISERIDNILLNLAFLSQYSGEFITFDEDDVSLFYCDSFEIDSVLFMLRQLFQEGYIENMSEECYSQLPIGFKTVEVKRAKENTLGFVIEIRLTAKGWSRVNELEKGNIDNPKNAFVAMSFDISLKSIYENAIRKAIIDAKFNPIRVDAEEYNDKICDEIIANIRKAKFVISDVTQQKNGVYFEAGFAMGLGKPVIWTCKKDDLGNLHFDTRQYNHIVWENEQDLYEKLLRRIEATII